MAASRRTFLRHVSAAPVAIGGVGAMGSVLPFLADAASASIAPYAQLGSITGNDPAGYLRFAKWFGRKPALSLMAFNQTGPAAMASSIGWACNQAAMFIADGAQILWSVPCPGAKQLEAIVAGNYDTMYAALFKSILAVSRGSTPILVRLPWEFNLSFQENAAFDKNGKFNGPLFVAAWQRIATIAKTVSPRFYRIWCPAVTTMSGDPQACWPGAGYVECVSQDFYMQTAYCKPGQFSYFLNEARGLQWGANFAIAKGKKYGLSEWGMNSDIFVPDLNSTARWLASLGGNVQHHCWWDRADVTDCRISDGTHPALAAAYKANFA